MNNTAKIYGLLMLGLISATTLVSTSAFAAMTSADCDAKWKSADTNADGTITETEQASYFAYYRLAGKSVADDKLTNTQFMTDCQSGMYDQAAVDAGAPLEGANSFTEKQAQDRAVAHGFSAVSTLTKDDKGIWRGTATQDGKQVNVAIDFKGNVVATM